MKILLLGLMATVLVSCSSTKNYKYEIEMDRPIESKLLTYENDTMSITFEFKREGIHFKIFNKMANDGIRINWDELSMSENGKALRVVHKETGVLKINDVQPPTTIPPRTILEDMIIPSGNIKYTYYAGNRTTLFSDAYPTTDGGNKKKRSFILNKKGQRVTVYFPFYIQGKFVSNTFDFVISDLYEVKKGQRVMPKK